MNSNIRVVNTAPLIFLAKIGRLEFLRLGTEQVVVPNTVLKELQAVSDDATKSVHALLKTWLIVKSCSQPALLSLARQAIDPGEAEVVALALELGTKDVVLDDLDARRFAYRSGLVPIGTLGLLLGVKKAGQLKAIKPEIEKLSETGFWISDRLLRQILFEAQE